MIWPLPTPVSGDTSIRSLCFSHTALVSVPQAAKLLPTSGLCTCCSLCLECSYPRSVCQFSSFSFQLGCHPLGERQKSESTRLEPTPCYSLQCFLHTCHCLKALLPFSVHAHCPSSSSRMHVPYGACYTCGRYFNVFLDFSGRREEWKRGILGFGGGHSSHSIWHFSIFKSPCKKGRTNRQQKPQIHVQHLQQNQWPPKRK